MPIKCVIDSHLSCNKLSSSRQKCCFPIKKRTRHKTLKVFSASLNIFIEWMKRSIELREKSLSANKWCSNEIRVLFPFRHHFVVDRNEIIRQICFSPITRNLFLQLVILFFSRSLAGKVTSPNVFHYFLKKENSDTIFFSFTFLLRSPQNEHHKKIQLIWFQAMKFYLR